MFTLASAIRMPPKEVDRFAITKERDIYARLVLNVGRGINQSVYVIGLLMTLDAMTLNPKSLITWLHSLPDLIVTVIADEAVHCLNCLTNDDLFLPFTGNKDSYNFLPVLKWLTDYKLSLDLLGNNRVLILNGTFRNVQDILRPAFEDITVKAITRAKSMIAAAERFQSIPNPSRSVPKSFIGDPLTSVRLRAHWNLDFELVGIEDEQASSGVEESSFQQEQPHYDLNVPPYKDEDIQFYKEKTNQVLTKAEEPLPDENGVYWNPKYYSPAKIDDFPFYLAKTNQVSKKVEEPLPDENGVIWNPKYYSPAKAEETPAVLYRNIESLSIPDLKDLWWHESVICRSL